MYFGIELEVWFGVRFEVEVGIWGVVVVFGLLYYFLLVWVWLEICK